MQARHEERTGGSAVSVIMKTAQVKGQQQAQTHNRSYVERQTEKSSAMHLSRQGKSTSQDIIATFWTMGHEIHR